MPTLGDIQQALEAKLKADRSLTVEAADVAFSADLTAFFKTLPQQTLNLAEAAIVPGSSGTSFQINGSVQDNWTIQGLASGSLTQVTLTIELSQATSTAPIVASLTINQAQLAITPQLPITLSGELNPSPQLALQISGGSSSERVGLAALYSYLGQEILSTDPFLNSIGNFLLSKLSLVATLGAGGSTQLQLQTAQDVSCQLLATPAVQLNSVGLSMGFALASSSAGGGGKRSFTCRFCAQATIVNPYSLMLSHAEAGVWQLTIQPTQGAFPSVADLAGWVGGASLQTQVQDAFTFLHLPALTVQLVQVTVDTDAKQLRSVEINGTISLGNFLAAIQVELPEGRFWFAYPPSAKLLPAETPPAGSSGLSITDLINQLFGTQTGFPNLLIDQCCISVLTSQKSYQVEIMTTEDWTFTVAGTNVFVLQSVVFLVDINGDNSTYTFSSEVTVCGVAFLVTGTRSVQGADASWQMKLTLNQTGVDISTFLNAFLGWLGLPTVPFPSLDIVALEIDYDSSTGTFDFNGTVYGQDSPDADSFLSSLEASLQVTRSAQATSYSVTGTLALGKAILNATFNSKTDDTNFSITWDDSKGGSFSINDLLQSLGVSVAVPDELNLGFKQFSLSYDVTTHEVEVTAETQSGKTLSGVSYVAKDGTRAADFCVQLGDFTFSSLPLVGSIFPYQLDSFTILICSAATTALQLAKLKGLPPMDKGIQEVSAGAYCLGTLQSSDDSYSLFLPIYKVDSPAPSTAALLGDTPPATMAASNTASFIQVQRTIGPIYIGQIGFEYIDQTVGILLNVGLVASALEIDLTGLYFGYSIPEEHISVDLAGLAIHFSSGPVTISGGFLRNLNPKTPVVEEFSGEALIQAESWTLSALGSYARIQSGGSEETSLFIFALLDYPLGGPPFFFVTGIAAGFGYNRAFNLPTLDQLPSFPLIQGATVAGGGPFAGNTAPDDALQVLADFVPPEAGQNWVVAGVQFTSFEQLHTVALVSVLFGTKFEIALLGHSTMSVPAGADSPIAYVEMAMEASFDPDAGLLAVAAQLTSESYVFSQSCRLTGGFAFYNWFSGPNEGQFVVTLGGYSPFFQPPTYYPTVPRLGINWNVNSDVTVKGQAYYAITPSCLMAGGYLEASFSAGPISAWFSVSADFLIAWKPFHYLAHVSVNIGVSAHISLLFTSFTLSAHVGADLTLWGPSFAGNVHIDLSIISFTISFGDSDPNPDPIKWPEFKSSFLPANQDVYCVANVSAGLLKSVTNSDASAPARRQQVLAADPPAVDWFITPETFTINVQSVIPILTASINGQSISQTDTGNNPRWNTEIGVGPIALPAGNLQSDYQITLTREGVNYDNVSVLPMTRNLPKGMWGALAPDINNSEQRICEALVGFQITGPPSISKETLLIKVKPLMDTRVLTLTFTWEVENVPSSDAFPRDPDIVMATITSSFQDTSIAKARQDMATAMADFGLDVNPAIVINPTGNGSAGLLQAPQLRVLGENVLGENIA